MVESGVFGEGEAGLSARVSLGRIAGYQLASQGQRESRFTAVAWLIAELAAISFWATRVQERARQHAFGDPFERRMF